MENELPSRMGIIKKYAYTLAITNRRCHFAALDTIVQNLDWNNIDAEVDFDIARHARFGKHAKQLEEAVDAVLAEDDVVPLEIGE